MGIEKIEELNRADLTSVQMWSGLEIVFDQSLFHD
jgi:hypothetical protein